MLVDFPVLVCPEISHIAGRMREHFVCRNFRSKVAVLQEGRETLTQWNMCVMHMTAGRLLKHQRKEHCFNNTEIGIRCRDVEVASRCLDMEFILTGGRGGGETN